MRFLKLVALLSIAAFLWDCHKEKDNRPDIPSNAISIDSLVATHYSVKAWDTTTITCYATGANLEYAWECDHGDFNGSGKQIKYAAGQCCVGINTITCKVSNETGHVSENIHIEVTSYFGGGK